MTGRFISRIAAALAWLVPALLLLAPQVAHAQDRAQLFVSSEDGFGRLILDFPGRLDLPPYRVRSENGVLSIEFEDQLTFVMPDVAVTLPEYITISRIDPDKRGVRFGLRTTLNFHILEAGEKLFVDLLPPDWQGLPPGLPPEVVADLTTRAKDAALLAEQERKAEEARTLKPVATLSVGRNPTFMRIEFNWNVETEGRFALVEGVGNLDFDWPVTVDLYNLKADLPVEIKSADNTVTPDGSRVSLTLGEGVVPRFYQVSPTRFIVDVDLSAEELAKTPDEIKGAIVPTPILQAATTPVPEQLAPEAAEIQTSIRPVVSMVGETLRISFPFDRDIASAAFQRGNVLWLLFDTPTVIEAPSAPLGEAAAGFTVTPAGNAQVVRIDVAGGRLATMGIEGRAWVLSLGDVLLNETQVLPLERRRNSSGQYELVADVARPGAIHEFRDPVVGDVLTVITAFGPARGNGRNLDFVDLTALRSAHGLALKPNRDDVAIALDGTVALIRTPGGLALSSADKARTFVAGNGKTSREGFLDLTTTAASNPLTFSERREDMITLAAESEGEVRDSARLKLAQFYVANQFGYEALGVLSVMETQLKADDLRRSARLTAAIANILAYRPDEALAILSLPAYAEEPDALLWRTIARSNGGDFNGARLDGLASEGVLESYPRWVRQKFLFAAIRAAFETSDIKLAERYLGMIEFSKLEPEDVTWYRLFGARLAEAKGSHNEAIDAYGQVIAADIRPTRAEAVYRTVRLLNETGDIDLGKASETLAGEAMMWRGDWLEADMQRIMADLFFRHHDYRLGFETVKQAVLYYPDRPTTDAMLAQAQKTFENLYINGEADAIEAVAALGLFYDFRQLTPAGTRGDEMIRNLARRLVQVDLLSQAADLLEYQIDDRLKGVAKAQVAADLAVIRLAARDPEGALRVLNRTRLSDLSPALERQRRILEARALIDSGRQELAVDLLRNVTGRDADMLRVEGLWKSKQYVAAGELIEITYSNDPQDLLNQSARLNIVKAAVGFVLGNDRLGLQRLRNKFGERLSQTPEWPIFDFVTGEVESQSVEFRKVAREVSGLDSLDSFLTAYRSTYVKDGDPAPDKAVLAKDVL